MIGAFGLFCFCATLFCDAFELELELDFVRSYTFFHRLRLWRNECVVSRQYIDLVPEEIRDRLFPTIHFQTSSTSRSTPLLPCPVDGCRGIVMLPSHACGLCNATLCPHCHSVCGTDSTASTASTHVCDPKHIQTVAEILQNTRACPKCATRIHRIDGCDQMWCTRCHTAFHWQNGMVLKNTMVHNPHFVQYQREQREARSAAEVYNNCDGLPEIQIVNNHLSTYANNQWSSEYPFRSVIRDVHRQCRDAQDLADRAAYGGGNNHNHNRRDPFFRNIDLRLRFLQNKMSSAEFETQLLRRHNQECVLHTCRSVWVLFVSVCTDVFHRFLHDNTLDTADSRAGYITEFSEIIRLINDRIRVVNTAYQWTSVPTIMPITDRFFRQTRQAQADELELRRPDRPEGPQVAAESSSSEDSF